MKHPIDREDWIDFADGTLPAPKRRQLETHLDGCAECREIARQFRDVEDFLSDAAPQPTTVSHAEMHAAKAVFYAGLQHQELISDRLARTHALLAPICGPVVTDQLLRTAARRASARSPESMAAHDWPRFVAHLTGIMSSMCGEPAALAVSESLAR